MANVVHLVQAVRMSKGAPTDVVSFGPPRNPQPLDLSLTSDTVDHYKKPDCRNYLRCLDVAAAAGWQQFHCNSCTAYAMDPADKLELAAMMRLAQMLDGESD